VTTFRRAAQKNSLKPWLKERWCIPPDQCGEFVARMEDLLDLYHRPFDPAAAPGVRR